MPVYGFECHKSEDGCGLKFDICCSRDEIVDYKANCPNCSTNSSVFRNFEGNIYVCDSSPKTVGALAERNSARMSKDHKRSLESEYKNKPKYTGTLPDGGSLIPVDSKGKKIASTKKGRNLGRTK